MINAANSKIIENGEMVNRIVALDIHLTISTNIIYCTYSVNKEEEKILEHRKAVVSQIFMEHNSPILHIINSEVVGTTVVKVPVQTDKVIH